MARASHRRWYFLNEDICDALSVALDATGDASALQLSVDTFLARHTVDDDDAPSIACVLLCDEDGETALELTGDDAARYVLADRMPDGQA